MLKQSARNVLLALITAPPIPSVIWFVATNLIEQNELLPSTHPVQTLVDIVLVGYCWAASVGLIAYLVLKWAGISTLFGYAICGSLVGLTFASAIGLAVGAIYRESFIRAVQMSWEYLYLDRALMGMLCGAIGMGIFWGVLHRS